MHLSTFILSVESFSDSGFRISTSNALIIYKSAET